MEPVATFTRDQTRCEIYSAPSDSCRYVALVDQDGRATAQVIAQGSYGHCRARAVAAVRGQVEATTTRKVVRAARTGLRRAPASTPD